MTDRRMAWIISRFWLGDGLKVGDYPRLFGKCPKIHARSLWIASPVVDSRAAPVRVAAYNRRQMTWTLGNHDR